MTVSGADRALAASAVEPVSRLAPTGFDHGDLEELAAQCEAATGPSRALDTAVCVALQYGGENSEGAIDVRPDPDDDGWLIFEIGTEGGCNQTPPVTASIDAAMMLVPEECKLRGFAECDKTGGGAYWHACLVPFPTPPPAPDPRIIGDASLPALALCAAALRTRAAIADTHPKDGDVKQAPLVSGGGAEGNRPKGPPMTPKPIDAEGLLARLRARVKIEEACGNRTANSNNHVRLMDEAADLITTQSKQIVALKQRVGELEGALNALAGIRAEDGDDFSNYPTEAIIRCEITAGDIHRARTALAQASETSNGWLGRNDGAHSKHSKGHSNDRTHHP